MTSYTFHVDQDDRDPVVRTRSMDGDAEAFAYALQLLKDWPDCRMIDVRQEGVLLNRLKPLHG